MDEYFNQLYLPTSTIIFSLVEIEHYYQQKCYLNISKRWANEGYTLKKSIVPESYQFENGTFNFKLNFTEDVNLEERALWYGFVNALNKGKVVREPFIIMGCSTILRKPIPQSFVNDVVLFSPLDKTQRVKQGILIKHAGAKKLSEHLLDEKLVIDYDLSTYFKRVLIPKFKYQQIDFTDNNNYTEALI